MAGYVAGGTGAAWPRHQESNLDLRLRRAPFYPLNYSERLMSNKTGIYLNAPPPDYTYVFRWWLVEDDDPHGTQSQVVVVRSDHPLTLKDLKQHLEDLGAEPTRFELVDMPRNCAAKLDTWEPFIEFAVANDSKVQRLPLVKEWWREDRA